MSSRRRKRTPIIIHSGLACWSRTAQILFGQRPGHCGKLMWILHFKFPDCATFCGEWDRCGEHAWQLTVLYVAQVKDNRHTGPVQYVESTQIENLDENLHKLKIVVVSGCYPTVCIVGEWPEHLNNSGTTVQLAEYKSMVRRHPTIVG